MNDLVTSSSKTSAIRLTVHQGIVGGCNLFYSPENMSMMSDLNFLSPDGICHSFDHKANGYSRGEGFGIIVVKPLSAAVKNGDTIRAVIRATGTNQDGRTPAITQPSLLAQEKLIRNTYDDAGLDMTRTRYFESHGTGTPVGDPLEASAIHAAFKNARDNRGPLHVGSVKTNIGHLEGAAGIAGVIKTILVLEKGIIPPNVWFDRLNPKLTSLIDVLNVSGPLTKQVSH
jgi:acyl transferase domain-containing protein